MENQHRKITGYRELNQKEIDLMNEIKEMGAKLEKLIEKVNVVNQEESHQDGINATIGSDCFRWASMAKTELQTGIMFLTRAVAKPKFF